MSMGNGAIDWKRLEDLFHAALSLDARERPDYLARQCGANAALRQEIESLLAFSDKTLDLLKRPVEVAAHAMAWTETGKTIGPYRLTELLGDGGMGQVYLAQRSDDLYEQRVAIKLMHSGVSRTPAMLLRFGVERQILADLNHPNIARLLDAGITAEGTPYLVMEYIDGHHIDDFCRRNKLDRDATLRLFLVVCSAVEYAHKNLVIHRDIKPANIIVDAAGTPKLLDFGIAKLLDADGANALTRVTERIMTPEYASPEQVRGEQVTTATDVYALGVLLYELLTGDRPFHFHGKSPLEVIHLISDQQPQAPSTVISMRPSSREPHPARRLDRDLDNIILMAMRKEPARRYAGVSAMAGDIQAYLSGYPVQARTDRWSYRSQKFIGRHKAGVTAAFLIVVTLIGFSIGMGILARRANRARLTAEKETQFLNTIFQAATPEQARGNPVMARDLLDQGAKRIDSELGDQPDLHATMLDNVGRAYSAIGLYSQASSLLQRAYQIRRRLLPRGSLDTASTEDALATALRLDGHYAQAEPYFRDALSIRIARLGTNHEDVEQSLGNLGECLYWEDRNAEAEPLLRRALDIDHRLNIEFGASIRNYLALVLERSGAFPEAAGLLREAVEIARRRKGVESSSYLVSLHNYAGALIDAGDLNAAEATEREVLNRREKIFGHDHPDVFYSLNNLAFILLEKGEWKQAMPILNRGVDLMRKVGIESKLVNALGNRARGFEQKGDYPSANRDLAEALSMMKTAADQESWLFAKITAGTASLQLARGDAGSAAATMSRALKLERELGGAGTPPYAGSLMGLGDALLASGEAAGAEAAYREALLIRKQKFNPRNPVNLASQVRLGEALIRAGKPAQAEPLLREAAALQAQSPFPLPPWRIAETNFALGACLLSSGQTDGGEELIRRSQGPLRDHPQVPFRWPAIARITGLSRR
jgi:eukaryotic-like serine/threonine-protein kinase